MHGKLTGKEGSLSRKTCSKARRRPRRTRVVVLVYYYSARLIAPSPGAQRNLATTRTAERACMLSTGFNVGYVPSWYACYLTQGRPVSDEGYAEAIPLPIVLQSVSGAVVGTSTDASRLPDLTRPRGERELE